VTFWAKTFADDWASASKPPFKPVVHHMLDVAAVAATFLEAQPKRLAREARSVGMDVDAYVRLISLLAGLHDLGKFSRVFQSLRLDLWPATLGSPPHSKLPGPPHWQISAALLALPGRLPRSRFTRLFPRIASGYDWELIAAIAGHHGSPPPDSEKMIVAAETALDRSDRGDRGSWLDAACVDAADKAIEGLLLCTDATPADAIATDNAPSMSWRLSGLITLVDWVGSDAKFFGPQPLETPLEVYWLTARETAKRAMRDKGLTPLEPVARPDIGRISADAGKTPRPMQGAVAEIDLAAGPQLTLIEDATGSGKTEAAMLLAARMMAAGLGEGVYVALPTMATANAMYARLELMERGLFKGNAPASRILAHGRAALIRNLEEQLGTDEDRSVAETCNAWIADDRRRAFFADIGAGTIDQAFLAVLPKRHVTLRQYALAGRILVIDEAHSFDAYMREELDTLLRLQAMNGGSAIVLSATLSQSARQAMARAFFEGLGCSKKHAIKHAAGCGSQDYPLLTRIDERGVAEFPQQLDPSLARGIAIGRLGSRHESNAAAVEAAAHNAAVVDAWMTAPAQKALMLQRPLAASALKIVARGEKEEGLPN
jgi:CRISPR-associated endonuclease/helicase Cas3